MLYAFLHRHGYRPKRKKHFIYSRGERMLVNGLVVNRHPALQGVERSAIRKLGTSDGPNLSLRTSGRSGIVLAARHRQGWQTETVSSPR